jgi:hypothetical protein
MLVEQLIRQLNEYPRGAEIYVEYWDKETVESMEEVDLTDDEWGQVVYQMEDGETSSYFSTALRFNETIEELRTVPLTERK